jgi:hemerythrin
MKTLEKNLGWSEKYTCYEGTIDQQHKQLIEDLNQLIQIVDYFKAFDDALDELTNYLIEHFKSEEEILSAKGYDQLGQHKEAHQPLVRELKTRINALENDKASKEQVIQYLIDVIIGHMLTYDYDFYHLFGNKII